MKNARNQNTLAPISTPSGKLPLRKETLRKLTSAELDIAVGGGSDARTSSSTRHTEIPRKTEQGSSRLP